MKYKLFSYEIQTLRGPFFLHDNLNGTGSLGYQFDSLWTNPWSDKTSIFLKIEKANKSIFPIEIRFFFLGKLYQKFLLFYALIT